MSPRIDIDKIVWHGNNGSSSEIFLYDISTGITTQITENSPGVFEPHIDLNNIVWPGFDGSDWEIFLHDISSGTTTQITDNDYNDDVPQIDSGRIVWWGNGNVFMATKYEMPPDNTPVGSPIEVDLGGGAKVVFSQITSAGNTSYTTGTPPYGSPAGFRFRGQAYDISTTATYSGNITVTIPYNPADVSGNESNLKLFHWTGTGWEDVTVSVDTVNNIITGRVTSLSPFAAAEPAAPPAAVPSLSGWGGHDYSYAFRRGNSSFEKEICIAFGQLGNFDGAKMRLLRLSPP